MGRGKVKTRVCQEEEIRESFVVFFPLIFSLMAELNSASFIVWWFSKEKRGSEAGKERKIRSAESESDEDKGNNGKGD